MDTGRFKARIYYEEKRFFNGGEIYRKTNRDGTLFAGKYRTKIIPTMLPEWYVRGRFYKCWGYMSVKGITDMKYIPNHFTDHFLKDDFLLISYGGKIVEKEGGTGTHIEKHDGVDEYVFGHEILRVLKGAREFSNIDIAPFIAQIKKKIEWLEEAYPDSNDAQKGKEDLDRYFEGDYDNARNDVVYALNIEDKRYYGSYREIDKYIDSLDGERFAKYITAFKDTEQGTKDVFVDTPQGVMPILEKLILISSNYQSLGIYEQDLPVPTMMAEGRTLTADCGYLFEMIAIEAGEYIRLVMPHFDNLRYADEEQPITSFPKDECAFLNVISGDERTRTYSKLYLKEKVYKNTLEVNLGYDIGKYDLTCFVKEIFQ